RPVAATSSAEADPRSRVFTFPATHNPSPYARLIMYVIPLKIVNSTRRVLHYFLPPSLGAAPALNRTPRGGRPTAARHSEATQPRNNRLFASTLPIASSGCRRISSARSTT